MNKAFANNLQLSVSNHFCQILQRELTKIKKWRKVAIRGVDPEGVHQTRVSLRKIRTALVIFRPLINKAFSLKMTKKIKKFSRFLDNARDLDVYLLNNFPQGIDRSALHAIVKEKRSDAYIKARNLLKSKAFKQFINKTSDQLRQSKFKKKLSRSTQNKKGLTLVRFAKTTLDQLYLTIIANADHIETLDDSQLHTLRIQCKKLRYATEFFLPSQNKKTNIFIENIKNIQTVLGEIHDCFIAKQLHKDITLSNETNDFALEQLQRIDAEKKLLSRSMKEKLIENFSDFSTCHLPWK